MAAQVSCVGAIVFDEVFLYTDMPSGDGKFFADGIIETGGGMAATAAVAAASLGAKTCFVGRVGDDAAGRWLLAELAGRGVDTRFCRLIPGARTQRSAVLVDASGERLIASFRDRSMDASTGWLPLPAITQADAVLSDIRWPAGAAKVLLAAQKRQRIGVLDADITSDPDAKIALHAASHLVFSRDGLAGLSGTTDLRAGLAWAQAQNQGIAAVTVGGAGSYWLAGEHLLHLQALRVAVRNTLGAGDVFHGALAVALAEAWEFSEAMRFATAAAALFCSRPPGWASMPSCAEVLERIGEVPIPTAVPG